MTIALGSCLTVIFPFHGSLVNVVELTGGWSMKLTCQSCVMRIALLPSFRVAVASDSSLKVRFAT